MKTTTKAHLAVFATNLFFAVNFTLVKIISPLLMGAYAVNVFRVGISILLFWFLWLLGKTPAGIQSKDWGRFIFCAISGVVVNQSFFIKGLTMTSAIHASLLMLATPLLVSFFALCVLKEKFTIVKALGLIAGVSGSVFLVLQKESGPQGSNYLLGDLLILINAISYSFYFISVKPLMEQYSPLRVTRWVFTLGFLVILPLGWTDMRNIHWSGFDFKYIMVISAIAITGTFLAYYFNTFGLQHLGAGITGTYIYTQPVFAVLIAVLFLNESFTWRKGLSALLIFTGVYLVSFRKKIPGDPVI